MAKIHTMQSPPWALLLFLCLTLPTGLRAQIIYVNGELLPGFAGLFKVDLATCTFCPVSAMNDGSDYDLTILPNGNVVNASSGFIAVFDPPLPNPITFLNIIPQSTTGNILNPAGNVYQATAQGLGVYNPVTNQFTYIGNWPASFLPIVEMELWYQGGQLYGYFGFPNLQVAQIDVNNPANSTIIGTINYSGPYFSGACNVGNTVYMSDEKTIFTYDPSTGNLNAICDFTGTPLAIGGLSSTPPGFQDYPCSCTTNAGSITAQGLTNYCTNQPINISHNGNQVLDGNDILRYALFSNPNDTVGSVIATSSTPNFVFAPPMQTGVTYYVAAVAGNNLSGNVDLADPCLDFSNANQIVWRPTPTVSFSAANPNVCSGACTTVTATFTGSPPFTLTYTNSVSGTVTLNFPALTGTLQVCTAVGALPGALNLQAIALTDAWCTCQ